MPITNNQIDKLGIRLRESLTNEDLEMLQEYRKSYSEALPFIFNKLRIAATKIDKRAIVTFRTKRIDTIIHKLKRFEKRDGNGDMRLSRMWDIAGCRCILSTPDKRDIFKLADQILKNKEIKQRCDANDYVTTPKKDGYRSYHMYLIKDGTDKPIEIQLRNYEMHNWATLVEIFDILYDLGIKEGNKTNLQQDFLYLYSQKNHLTRAQGIQLIQIENKLHIFTDMCNMFSRNYAAVREQWAVRNKKKNYLVLEAGRGFPTTIEAFSQFDEAEECYYKKYLERRNTNLVMVYSRSADFKDISFAYSNYILSVHSFFFDYKKIIENSIVETANTSNLFLMLQLMCVYRKILLKYFDCIHDEVIALNKNVKKKEQLKVYEIEWQKDLKKELQKWADSVSEFTKKLARSISNTNNTHFYSWMFNLYFRHLVWGINRKMRT